MTTKFQERVYDLCSRVPRGRVTTYGAIARKLHSSPRAVGGALRKNPYAPRVPCHRVVKSDGSLGGFDGRMNNPKKPRILRKEGIEICKGRIKGFENKKMDTKELERVVKENVELGLEKT